MRLLIAAFLLSTSVFGQNNPVDQDWKVSVTASGSLTSGEKFNSIGVATFAGIDGLLTSQGGFDAAYREFKRKNNITYGVWQEAEAFSNHLKDCEIDIPADVLAMKLGLNKIINSKDDAELDQTLSDLAPHLSFERKIELASRLGGVLLQGYDYERSGGGPNGSGIVTLRQMLDARKNGTSAGVCRDMSQALAQSLKKMGVDQAYVVAYQTAGGGHATVLAQDPNNPGKTYNINYNFMTSTESGSALSHLQQDSTIPSVGVDMRIFDADGKPMTTLPTHLGVALHEIAGGSASDIDPLLRSENRVVGARYRVNNNLSVGAGASTTPDGDRIVAGTATYENYSENFPMKMSVVVYNNQRETNNRGDLNSTGVYMEGEQRLISDPFIMKSSRGTVSMNLEGRLGMNSNLSFNSTTRSDKTTQSVGMDMNAAAGVRTAYVSPSSNTRADLFVQARGGIAKSDVRDEGSTTFDLRDVSASARISQRLASNLDGFTGSTLIMRPGLGIQSSQELGLIRRNADDSQTAILFERQGSFGKDAPVFVPGSRNEYSVDVRHLDEKYAVEGSAFCRILGDNRKDCGLRSTATIRFGGPRN